MTRASISIFSKKVEYSDDRTKPETPSKVFEAAQRVIESKGCELLRDKTGLYVIEYAENGPGKQKEGWSGWLPVYIAKIESWSSGGITEDEMHNYKENQNEE